MWLYKVLSWICGDSNNAGQWSPNCIASKDLSVSLGAKKINLDLFVCLFLIKKKQVTV